MTSSSFQGAMVPLQTADPAYLPTPNTSSAVQVELAAAAAAAVPNITPSAVAADNLTADEKAKQNRDRNREHARTTRLRKKAYVQKLKELVEGLHAERTEEVRKRRVAMQHLADKQNVRRAVVRSFLRLHSNYESDPRKWMTILEDDFWLKQPVTPYRAFRRDEIEQVRVVTREACVGL
jgi:ribosome-binding protein aMBF1 (putative translation factor)